MWGCVFELDQTDTQLFYRHKSRSINKYKGNREFGQPAYGFQMRIRRLNVSRSFAAEDELLCLISVEPTLTKMSSLYARINLNADHVPSGK